MKIRYQMLSVASLVVLISCGLVACASKQLDFRNQPGEFNFTKVQNDLYDVRYVGEPYSTLTKAKQRAAQRVSTLCLHAGYRYFLVLNKEATFIARPGDVGYAPEHSAAQAHQVPVIKASVRLFKKEPTVQTMPVYDAAQVEQTMSAF